MKGQSKDASVLPPEGLTRVSKAFELSGFSRATGWRRIKAGTYPSPIRLSPGISVIANRDLLAWLRDPLGWCAKQSEKPAAGAKAQRNADA